MKSPVMEKAKYWPKILQFKYKQLTSDLNALTLKSKFLPSFSLSYSIPLEPELRCLKKEKTFQQKFSCEKEPMCSWSVSNLLAEKHFILLWILLCGENKMDTAACLLSFFFHYLPQDTHYRKTKLLLIRRITLSFFTVCTDKCNFNTSLRM